MKTANSSAVRKQEVFDMFRKIALFVLLPVAILAGIGMFLKRRILRHD